MTQLFSKQIIKTGLTLSTAFILLFSPVLPSQSYAEVIDGEKPVESVITMSEIYNDLRKDYDLDADHYRTFFNDMIDTSAFLMDDFEKNKTQLKMVSNKLQDFKVTTKESLSTFEAVQTTFNDRLTYYNMIKDALIKSIEPVHLADGTQTLTLNKTSTSDSTTLTINPSGDWSITESKDEVIYYLANVTIEGDSTFKVTNAYDDFLMVSGDASDLYIGAMNAFDSFTGTGTKYSVDGSIDHGRWIMSLRTGLHYIVNTEEQYTAVTQFKDGNKHGMSSFKEFDSDNVYTRIFIDDKIQGYSYSEFIYEDYVAEVMYYYENEKRLPLAYIKYPDRELTRMVIGETENQVEIYDSKNYDRLFINKFVSGKPSGFGYTRYGEIEYIGTFDNFNILADGQYYNLNDVENVFQVKIDSIIDEIIEKSMTDRQKLLAVHNYVVDAVDYHKPHAKINEHPSITHTAYGALMNGSAVCDGYAQAFKVLLNELGFENHLIFGITTDADGVFQEDNRHAWNIVKYNGAFTHFDTTWDDPTYSDKIRHTYYFIDTEEIKEDHQWDEETYQDYLSPVIN